MADIVFRLRKIWDAYPYRAARAALFIPLFGDSWVAAEGKGKPVGKIAIAMHGTRDLWKKRLTQLRHADWNALRAKSAMQYMRNCPPFGYSYPERAYPCKRPLLCPFCYARQYVIDTFRKIEDFLYDGPRLSEVNRQRPTLRTDVGKLVAFRAVRTIQMKNGFAPEYMPEFCKSLQVFIRQHRRREVDLFPGCRAIVLHTLEPAEEEHGFKLRRSGVILTTRPVPEEFRQATTDLVETRTANKKELANVLPRIFAYPVGMLRGDAMMVSTILENLANAKMLASYGVWAPGAR